MSEPIEVGNKKPRKRIVVTRLETTYYFDFPIFNNSDINIYINEVLQTQGYVITTQPNIVGGNVTFTTPPNIGDIITIYRNLPLKRTTNFKEIGPFMSSKVNYEFDYMLGCIEQVEETISRTVTFPPYAPTQLNANLPLPEAGKAIIWNEKENNLQNSAFKLQDLDQHISDTLNASKENLEILAQNQEYLEEVRTTKEELTNIKPYVDNSLDSKANVDADNFSQQGLENIFDFDAPDYTRGTNINFPFNPPSKGYLYLAYNGGTSNIYIYVNINGMDQYMGICSHDGNHGHNDCLYKVKKGDKIVKESSNGAYIAKFFPMRGDL